MSSGCVTSAGERPISCSRVRPSIRQSASLTSSQRQSGADDRHADGRVREAAPEAVLADPPQRARGGARTGRARCCRRRRRASGRRARRRRRRRARRRRATISTPPYSTATTATSSDRVRAARRPRTRTARGRRRTARSRSPGRRSPAASPLISSAARTITPRHHARRRAVEAAGEQRRPRAPRSRRRARSTRPSCARSGCGSATQISTIAAPPAISHPMARARARRPAECASIARPYPTAGRAGQLSRPAGAPPTRSIQARRSGVAPVERHPLVQHPVEQLVVVGVDRDRVAQERPRARSRPRRTRRTGGRGR